MPITCVFCQLIGIFKATVSGQVRSGHQCGVKHKLLLFQHGYLQDGGLRQETVGIPSPVFDPEVPGKVEAPFTNKYLLGIIHMKNEKVE